jgi:hypothetical protein
MRPISRASKRYVTAAAENFGRSRQLAAACIEAVLEFRGNVRAVDKARNLSLSVFYLSASIIYDCSLLRLLRSSI